MDRKFHDIKKFKRHGFFHIHNPFNFLLKRHLSKTLGIGLLGSPTVIPPLYASTVLDQGENETCSEEGTYTARQPVTGKTYVIGDFIAKEQQFTDNNKTTAFDTHTALATAVLYGLKATDGTIDQPAAAIYVYPENGMDFFDTVMWYILQYQRPVNVAIEWFYSYEQTENGIIPEGQPSDAAGGHWTTITGRQSPTVADNQETWGVNAPGSMLGHYGVPRDVFNLYWQGLGAGILIDSTDPRTKLIGKLNAYYVQLIELLNLA